MRERQSRNGWLFVVLLVAALGFAGCGGDDDGDGDASNGSDTTAAGGDGGGDAPADADGDGADGSADSGGDAVEVTGGDFPIPIPDGVVLDALADAGVTIETQRQLFYPDGDFDRLVTFYDDWTSNNGEWARTELEGMVTYLLLDGDGIGTISITPGHDPGAQADGPVTFVILAVG